MEKMRLCSKTLKVIRLLRRVDQQQFRDIGHTRLLFLLHRIIRSEYRSHFHEILIDEYQDSNLVQEYILSCISGEEEAADRIPFTASRLTWETVSSFFAESLPNLTVSNAV